MGNGLDGTETASLILQDRDLPIVFLSSHTEPELVVKTEKLSSYGYVVKNSSITVLDASIKMAFKLFEANQQLKASRDGLKTRLIALTQPLESGAVTFSDLFNLEEIQQLQDKFAAATGVASIILIPMAVLSAPKQFYPALLRDRFKQIARLLYSLANQLSITAYHNVLQARMIPRHELSEQKLMEQKTLLEGIMAISPLSIFVKDCYGIYRMINKAGAKILGYSAEEIIGRTDKELLPESTASEFFKTDTEVMISGNTLIHVERGIIKGQEHIFKATKSPLLGASGEVLGIFGFSQVITNQSHTNKDPPTSLCN